MLGACGSVTIGNNVFIGRNAIITRNVTIGDNVIIGVGSVVTKDCESNSVYAGVPAKRIMDLEKYLSKRVELQLQEAKELAIKYYDRYQKKPTPEVFHEYFMLFSSVESVKNESVFYEKLKLCGNLQQSIDFLSTHPPIFQNFEEFMRYCFDETRR